MDIVLCDDNIEELNRIQAVVEDAFATIPDIHIYAFHEVEEMMHCMEKTDVFACILDIEMPDIDGITLAERISKCYPQTYLVFCSKRDDLVFQAIHKQPIGFVRKNYLETELIEITEILKKRYENDYKRFRVPETDMSVLLQDIVYFESCQHNILMQTVNGIKEFRGKVGELEKMLREQGFIRIHKGFIVNARFISKITFRKLVLENGRELPVSRTYYDSAKQQYLKEMEKMIYG